MVYKDDLETLKEILGMESYPVGVKFLKDKDIDDSFDSESKLRYCQALMKARYGNRVVLDKNNITCPASAAAFGFKPLVEKLRTGDMLHKMGLFAYKEAASHTMDMIPRLGLNYYKAVALAPLEEWKEKVDVVVVYFKETKQQQADRVLLILIEYDKIS